MTQGAFDNDKVSCNRYKVYKSKGGSRGTTPFRKWDLISNGVQFLYLEKYLPAIQVTNHAGKPWASRELSCGKVGL